MYCLSWEDSPLTGIRRVENQCILACTFLEWSSYLVKLGSEKYIVMVEVYSSNIASSCCSRQTLVDILEQIFLCLLYVLRTTSMKFKYLS